MDTCVSLGHPDDQNITSGAAWKVSIGNLTETACVNTLG